MFICLKSIFKWFPLFHLLLIVSNLLWVLSEVSIASCSLFIFIIYFFPLLTWRLLFTQVKEGRHALNGHKAGESSWLISHYIQYNFINFPVFERLLIIIPGAYSAWLRLWGSEVGKKVVWTPNMVIYDRSLMKINDFAFIGDFTLLGAHVFKRHNEKMILMVKKIVIGKKAVIGARSNLGPGAYIPDSHFLPAHSRAMLGRIERGEVGSTFRA